MIFDPQVSKYIFLRIFEYNRSNTIGFEDFVHLDVACSRNRNMARTFMRRRQLLYMRDSAIASGRITGAAAQCDLRTPLAQSRPSAAPQNQSRRSQTHSLVALYLPTHASSNHIASSIRTSTSTLWLPSRRGALGLHPSTQQIPRARHLAGGGRNN